MGVICDLFSCYHLNGGPMEKVQLYITPSESRIIELTKRLECDPYQMYGYVQSLEYVDPVDDDWQMPVETLAKGAGDCLDFSALLTSMLIQCGHKAWISMVYLPDANSGEPEFHAYVETLIDGAIVKLETTCPPHKCSFGHMPDVKMIKMLDFDHTGILKKYT